MAEDHSGCNLNWLLQQTYKSQGLIWITDYAFKENKCDMITTVEVLERYCSDHVVVV